MLRAPSLAKCNDRKSLAKVHPIAGNPEDWFKTINFYQRNYYSLSFDFFIDWTKKSVPNEIWIKSIVNDDVQNWPITNGTILEQEIASIAGQTYLSNLRKFSINQNLICNFQLFKDLPSSQWGNNPDEIVSFNLLDNSTNIHSPLTIQSQIRKLRGTVSNIGPGGLIYGTSTLECYLSTSPDFWPGDVDTLLVDNNHEPVAILEFKKHNKSSPITQQQLSNYRNRDKLKYESLGLLRDHFSSDVSLPIFIIYYSTRIEEPNIKIEKVGGSYNNLTTVSSSIFPIPSIGDTHSLERFCLQFLNSL